MNTSEPGDNFGEDAVIGEDGDFIVTWTEGFADLEVFARRFDAETAPLGGPVPHGCRRRARSSGFVYRPRRVRPIGRSFGGTTKRQTSWAGVSPPTERPSATSSRSVRRRPSINSVPFVASDPSGNFVVTWGAGHDGNATWWPGVSTVTVLRSATSSRSTSPRRDSRPPTGIAMSAAGFVVTWKGDRRFRGLAASSETCSMTRPPGNWRLSRSTPTPSSTRMRRHPDVAMNAAGDFVVVWSDGTRATTPPWVAAYDSAGVPLGGRLSHQLGYNRQRVCSPGSPRTPRATSGRVGVRTATRAMWPRGFFDLSGAPVTEEFQVNETTTHRATRTRPSLANDGAFLVAFTTDDDHLNTVKGRKSAVRAAPEIVMDPPPGLRRSAANLPATASSSPAKRRA